MRFARMGGKTVTEGKGVIVKSGKTTDYSYKVEKREALRGIVVQGGFKHKKMKKSIINININSNNWFKAIHSCE